MLTKTDVDILLDYLSRQWLPVPVLEACRKLRAHVELVDVDQSSNRGEIRYVDGSTYYNSLHELTTKTTANLLNIRESVEDVKAEVVRLQQENAELRAKMKPDAAYF